MEDGGRRDAASKRSSSNRCFIAAAHPNGALASCPWELMITSTVGVVPGALSLCLWLELGSPESEKVRAASTPEICSPPAIVTCSLHSALLQFSPFRSLTARCLAQLLPPAPLGRRFLCFEQIDLFASFASAPRRAHYTFTF